MLFHWRQEDEKKKTDDDKEEEEEISTLLYPTSSSEHFHTVILDNQLVTNSFKLAALQTEPVAVVVRRHRQAKLFPAPSETSMFGYELSRRVTSAVSGLRAYGEISISCSLELTFLYFTV